MTYLRLEARKTRKYKSFCVVTLQARHIDGVFCLNKNMFLDLGLSFYILSGKAPRGLYGHFREEVPSLPLT